jgi:hypothetical protein
MEIITVQSLQFNAKYDGLRSHACMRIVFSTKTLLLVGWAKNQCIREDKLSIFCISQEKNIDNESHVCFHRVT